MVNEALWKMLCHRRRCLIQSAQEQGITTTVWNQAAAPAAETTAEIDLVEAWARS
jgi:hypothetical protein